mmetsp:Transcript_28936/g.42915  ORF Transcript_28936/g.42915 Transcript_28936/m.42915 type:complete len:108 (-) Transcript_28936:1085-1408(-)
MKPLCIKKASILKGTGETMFFANLCANVVGMICIKTLTEYHLHNEIFITYPIKDIFAQSNQILKLSYDPLLFFCFPTHVSKWFPTSQNCPKNNNDYLGFSMLCSCSR